MIFRKLSDIEIQAFIHKGLSDFIQDTYNSLPMGRFAMFHPAYRVGFFQSALRRAEAELQELHENETDRLASSARP